MNQNSHLNNRQITWNGLSFAYNKKNKQKKKE